ncbi:hypothetical protein CEXT_212061 [Caerostris extrusa]|uniref:Uncharacterized protein n=1 Tax=Caerostris extrusa TaxID=172846 RepID=A0AAV4S3X1_CAEEX|nr:hypothetical protein CEXT_212061 [Caerostris extrusa]
MVNGRLGDTSPASGDGDPAVPQTPPGADESRSKDAGKAAFGHPVAVDHPGRGDFLATSSSSSRPNSPSRVRSRLTYDAKNRDPFDPLRDPLRNVSDAIDFHYINFVSNLLIPNYQRPLNYNILA